MHDKLNIINEMSQFDKKNRDFYDSLDSEERKKFSNYLMIRWGSCVQGSRELQEFYVISTNERLNKHFFTINKHPKLQWLCASTVSPDMGTHRHQWIPPRKKEEGSSAKKKLLADLFPNRKIQDIELLASMMTKKEIESYRKDHGGQIT